MRGERSRLDIKKNLERVDDLNKIVQHKRELQQCDFYSNMLMVPPLDPKRVNEAEQFANNMYQKLMKESLEIAIENTAVMPRNIDYIDNLKMNLQAIHTMLVEIIEKEVKDIVDKDST